MQYETKFGMGQKVWMVSHGSAYRIVKCPTCSQTGKIMIGGEEFICPKCSGRAAHRQWGGDKYYVSDYGNVGKISAIHQVERRDPDDPEYWVEYMIDTTGVGSGTVWKEWMLFATAEAAQAFCDAKNGALLPDECEMGVETI